MDLGQVTEQQALIFLVGWLGGCLIVAAVAVAMHRRPLMWFALSLVLSPPFALIGLVLILGRKVDGRGDR